MKRLLVCSFLLICILLTVFGISPSATASGKDLEEARFNAKVQLASFFSTRVTSVDRVTTSAQTTADSSTSYSHYYQDINVLTDVELLGVSYRDEHEGTEEWVSTAYLDDSTSLPLYIQKLTQLQRSIVDLENRPTDGMSLAERKFFQKRIVDYYVEFETYFQIAIVLDPDATLPTLVRTRAGAELDYYALVNEEIVLLQEDLSILQRDPSPMSLAQQHEAMIKMQQIESQIAENRLLLQSARQEAATKQQEIMDRNSREFQEIVFQMKQRAELATLSSQLKPIASNNPSEYLDSLEKTKQLYTSIYLELQQKIDAQRTIIINRSDETLEELMNRPYRAAELLGNQPTDEAQALRNQLIKEEWDRRDAEIEAIITELRSSVEGQLNEYADKIWEGMNTLSDRSFFVTSAQPEFSMRIGKYNGYQKSWPVAFRFPIMGEYYTIDTHIPYEVMTQRALPPFLLTTQQQRDEYENYLDTVDLFEAYLTSVATPLAASIEFNFDLGSLDSEYLIVIKRITLSRSDLGAESYAIDVDLSAVKPFIYQYHPSSDVNVAITKFIEQAVLIEHIERKKQEKIDQKKLWMRESGKYYLEGIALDMGLVFQDNIELKQNPVGCWNLTFQKTIAPRVYIASSLVIGFFRENKDETLTETSYLDFLAGLGLIFPILKDKLYNRILLKPFAEIKAGIRLLLPHEDVYRNPQYPLYLSTGFYVPLPDNDFLPFLKNIDFSFAVDLQTTTFSNHWFGIRYGFYKSW